YQSQQNMVPDLMKFKCSPCQAEKEKTAFTGDGDGWMSRIISRGFFRFRICQAWYSTECPFDILVFPHRWPTLGVPVLWASFFRPCRFRIESTNQTCSN